MQKKFQLYSIANAIMDVLVQVDDEMFSKLDIERGSYGMVSSDEQGKLLEKVSTKKSSLMSGGSAANSVIAFASLGGSTAMTAVVGSDKFGEHYKTEVEELGVIGAIKTLPGSTGTCLSVITPDAERTMRTDIGVAPLVSVDHLDESILSDSEILLLEGYVLSDDISKELVHLATEKAKNVDGLKIAFTPSAKFIIDHFRSDVDKVAALTDILFCNSEEAECLTGLSSPADAAKKLNEGIPHVVVTDGGNGVYLSIDGESSHVPAFSCEPKDMTGAGDIFAGSYLYGITHGRTPQESAKSANLIASKLVEQVGARFAGDIKNLWNQ